MGDASSRPLLGHGRPTFENVKMALMRKTLLIPDLREVFAKWPLEVNVHAEVLETAVEADLAQ